MNDPIGIATFILLLIWFARDQWPNVFKRSKH